MCIPNCNSPTVAKWGIWCKSQMGYVMKSILDKHLLSHIVPPLLCCGIEEELLPLSNRVVVVKNETQGTGGQV